MTKIGSLTCFGQKPEAEGQIRKRGFLSLLCLKKPEVFKLAGLHALRIKTKTLGTFTEGFFLYARCRYGFRTSAFLKLSGREMLPAHQNPGVGLAGPG